MLVAALAALHHELLLFAAVGFALGGIDDVLVDLLFLFRKAWRDLTIYARHPRMTTASLPVSCNPGKIAIFVPAWQEATVIGPMLHNALSRWGAAHYRIFVGTYPNDPATINAVATCAESDPRLTLAVNNREGPTTKADCLNLLWRAMLAEEEAGGFRYKAIILHDAEDVVHADEIRLFDFMIDRFDLVQLPVLPLPGRGGWFARAIANHYGDEFAESHGRLLIVREALGASVPSAGVACAFERNALAALAHDPAYGPFDPSCLTEDYEAGLRIRAMGGRGVFVRMRDAAGELVATREYFPDSIQAAVRQKARWIVGISLAGWDRMGWQGGVAEWWMRLRDRRSALTALVLFAAYLTLLLWVALWAIDQVYPRPTQPLPPFLTSLLWFNLGLMIWRGVMRVLFVTHAYGWRYGLGAIPRTVVANLVAILAARRAVFLYVRSLLGKPLTWDKTHHHFPDLRTDP
ncbi:glycosyl transferase family protein [Sphingobium sp. BYY-5]|uniref:glycosyl transferase family protein n=1 Tax=Sphingobium sp. BYY-5 TaxID=2926400 RepID=UPI001FA77966|nr:glycosyl transferase family protein [Sphingobium sp. BYY-5]MCI4588722.1 glycosyl transferase family protein [Sphingobium sp. BYY-5]